MSAITPHERSDETQAQFGFGKGGVPWYLMLFYLGFLTFFVWYVLEHQLPSYLDEGPIGPGNGAIPEATE